MLWMVPDRTTLDNPVVADPTIALRLGPGGVRHPGPDRGRRSRFAVALVVLAVSSIAVLAAVVAWRQLRPDEPRGAWGGHENGRIPAAELCPLPGAPGHLLRCDAAAAYGNLATAYRARFGTRLCITDSYRPYEAQVAAWERKPELAATPGKSNHGWALAVDLCGGANDFGTRQHRWLQANAGRYGWRQPTWAAKGGSRPEPWHWEFGAIS